jgi:hypothetical protein
MEFLDEPHGVVKAEHQQPLAPVPPHEHGRNLVLAVTDCLFDEVVGGDSLAELHLKMDVAGAAKIRGEGA